MRKPSLFPLLSLLLLGSQFWETRLMAQLPVPTYGWNLGNTLEATPTEGAWGPRATKELIDSVASSGINTIRLPCSWDIHADPKTHVIDPEWMRRVKEVVDWCYAKNLHIILNSHWDGGWLDANLSEEVNPLLNEKMEAYWRQIATTFRDYDERLLFAGANEPPADTPGKWRALMAYYQTFVDTVRSTGGFNTQRWLYIQGPNADIDLTDKLVTSLPKDSVEGRIGVEVHYYSPYQWCLMEKDADWGKRFYFWGKGYHHPSQPERNATWGEEAYLHGQFEKMANKFVAKGIPVILGEFEAGRRTGQVSPNALQLHEASRTYFHRCVVETANSRGLRPIYWDTPQTMYDWSTGHCLDRDNLRSLVGGAALPPTDSSGVIPNGVYRIRARHSGMALEVGSFRKAQGVNVRQASRGTGENQFWVVTHLGSNRYEIAALPTADALEVSGGSSSAGANVQTWQYLGGGNQQWFVTPTVNGYFRLSPSHALHLCLDVEQESRASGANVQIWEFHGGENQEWAFESR